MGNPRDLIKLGKLLLTDEKFPDPVVPPDLHLIKAVHADADGRVACIRCGAHVPIGDADMVGSDGYVCASCSARAAQAQPVAAPVGSLRRSPLPFVLVALGLIVLAIILIAHG